MDVLSLRKREHSDSEMEEGEIKSESSKKSTTKSISNQSNGSPNRKHSEVSVKKDFIDYDNLSSSTKRI